MPDGAAPEALGVAAVVGPRRLTAYESDWHISGKWSGSYRGVGAGQRDKHDDDSYLGTSSGSTVVGQDG